MRTPLWDEAGSSAVFSAEMGTEASRQLALFAQSILLGLGAGVVYDSLRPFRRRFPRSTAPLDILYSLTVAAAGFLFLLRRAEGVLRGFFQVGAAGCAVH